MDQLTALMVEHAVAVVFIATFVSRIGLPLPAAPLLVVAGALAAAAQPLVVVALVAASWLGNVLGNGVWFYAGRLYGYRFMRLLCKISVSPDSCVRSSETMIGRWGGLSLVAAKFVPGVSVVAPPMAGALGMSSLRFLAFETAGALMWTAIFLALGWLFRDQIQSVLDTLSEAGGVAVVALVIALVVFVAFRYWRRRVMLRLTGLPRVTVGELLGLLEGEPPPIVIDVRGEGGVQVDPRRIPGALPISLKEIQQRRARLPFEGDDREIILYCSCPNEISAALGAQALLARGMKRARPLAGGLEAWVEAGHPTLQY